VILMLPVGLFLVNLPNKGFSIEHFGEDGAIEIGSQVVAKDGELVARFKELETARLTQAGRDFFSGKPAKLKGMFVKVTDREFTLFRIQMTCCAADSLPLKVRIIAPKPVDFEQRQWVEVTGRIQFRKLADRDEYIPMMLLDSNDQVKQTLPDNNEYEF